MGGTPRLHPDPWPVEEQLSDGAGQTPQKLMSFDQQDDAYADRMEPLQSLNWEPPVFVRRDDYYPCHKKRKEEWCDRYGPDGFMGHTCLPPRRTHTRTRTLAHFEAAANSIIGIVLAQLVLLAFGVPLHEAVALNAVMIGVSYARSFVLRLAFARWAR
jgi:hypothetical protein